MNAKIGNNVEHPLEKIVYPETIVIIGLSSKPTNISRMILENLLRWGFRGKIFGLNSRSEEAHVDGVKMYKEMAFMLTYGLRPQSGIPGHHVAIIEFAEKHLGKQFSDLVTMFDRMLRKRNQALYDVRVFVSKHEAQQALHTAAEYLRVIRNEIGKRSPQRKLL